MLSAWRDGYGRWMRLEVRRFCSGVKAGISVMPLLRQDLDELGREGKDKGEGLTAWIKSTDLQVGKDGARLQASNHIGAVSRILTAYQRP